jgi:hypothetical protein
MNLYYFYILFTAVIVYWVFQDPNVPRYIELRIQLLRIDIARWFMLRKIKGQLMDYEKEAKKIMKERMKNNGEDKM